MPDAAIGIERERLARAAGPRTHMLVAVGAALPTIVSAFGSEDVRAAEQIALDPSRIAAQVVSGIGFIGADTILVLRRQVIRGLATAASRRTPAAAGVAVGGLTPMRDDAGRDDRVVFLCVEGGVVNRLHAVVATRRASRARRIANASGRRRRRSALRR